MPTCLGENNTAMQGLTSQDMGASLVLQPQDSSMTKKLKSAFQEIPQTPPKEESPVGDGLVLSILPGTINY